MEGRYGFLDRLPPGAGEELRRLGVRRRFPAGSTLFMEADEAHEALVLVTGEVKVSVAGADGRDVILDVLGPGELLGELSALDGRCRSATVMALGPVEVLAVPIDGFSEFLRRHPTVLHDLACDVVLRLRATVRRQLEFGTGDALGRVCARLLELADRYGRARPDGVVVIASPLNQSELASWTGQSREAVVKALAALRRLGWIGGQGATIELHEPAKVAARATR